jgi:hypothetical protein
MRTRITFNDERQLLGAGGIAQFAIDGLHFPLFWAAFPPVLGCFVYPHRNGGCEDRFVF